MRMNGNREHADGASSSSSAASPIRDSVVSRYRAYYTRHADPIPSHMTVITGRGLMLDTANHYIPMYRTRVLVQTTFSRSFLSTSGV